MIRDAQALSDLDARDQREAYTNLTYAEALGRMASLWAEARALNPDIGQDWRHDLAPALAVARAINGLPPPSPDIEGLIADLASALQARQIPFMLIGGHVVGCESQPSQSRVMPRRS